MQLQPGATAADGTGQRNSPYTAALLAHLERSNTELRVMFGDVGAEVVASTGADQQPFIYTSLSGEHYLNSPAEPAAVAVVARDGALAAEVQQETVFWQSVADSGTPADFEAYLDQFPGGTYSALARIRMETLLAASNASPLARAAAETAELQQETVFWQSVADSGNPADFEAYLGQFPDGTYSVLARIRMDTLLAASNASPLARAAAETAELQQETVFWQSVADSGTPADFGVGTAERQFPDGTYSVLARDSHGDAARSRGRPAARAGGGRVRARVDAVECSGGRSQRCTVASNSPGRGSGRRCCSGPR